MKRKFWLVMFYGFANHLPDSYSPVRGGDEKDVVIGDYSGIGANCRI